MLSILLVSLFSFTLDSQWTWQAGKNQSIENIQSSEDQIFVITGGTYGNLNAFDYNGRKQWTFYPQNYVKPGSSYSSKNLTIHTHLNGLQQIFWGTAWASRSFFSIDPNGSLNWFLNLRENPLSMKSGWILSQAIGGDLTGDGFSESLIGAGKEDRAIYLIDGATGIPLWRRFMESGSPFTSTAIGDLNDDGFNDFIVGESGANGYVSAINGNPTQNGSFIWKYFAKTTVGHLLPYSDINQDSVPEVLSFDWAGRITLISGQTGDAIYTIETSMPFMEAELIDDINGDGFKEVAAVGSRSRVYFIDVKNGQILWEYKSEKGTTDYHWALDSALCGSNKYFNVLVGSFSGHLTCIDSLSGKIIFDQALTEQKILSLHVGKDFIGVGSQFNLDTLEGGVYFHLNE